MNLRLKKIIITGTIGSLFFASSPLILLAQVDPNASVLTNTALPKTAEEQMIDNLQNTQPLSNSITGISDPTKNTNSPVDQNAQILTAPSGASKTDLDDKGICTVSFTGNFKLTACVGWLMFATGGRILDISGTFFNYAIDLSVVKMRAFMDGVGAINVGWKVLRDLANIFFIFILIYIAIKTILGVAEGQTFRMVRNVILVALFINFSMFFTRVLIDASNIATLQFYNSISHGPSEAKNGLSWVFLSGSRIQTLFSTTNNTPKQFADTNHFLIGFLSLVFAIILSFAFLAIGILFVIRLVIFIILAIFSPIAFLGLTGVPRLRDAWNEWWDELLNQVLFAPVLMIILWVTAGVVNSPGFAKALSVTTTDANFLTAVTDVGPAALVFVNFAILVIMLIGGIIISKRFGGKGSAEIIGQFDKWSRKIAAAGPRFAARGAIRGAATVGRQTLGRASDALSKLPALERLASSDNVFGRIAGKGVVNLSRKVGDATFDLRNSSVFQGAGGGRLGLESGGSGGYKTRLEKSVKEETEFAKSLSAKIYANDSIKRDVEFNETISKNQKDRIDYLQKQIFEAKRSGKNTTELEDQLEVAVKARDAAEKEIKTIDADRTKATTATREYARNTDTAFNRAISAAQEEARTKIEKDYTKGDSEWAENYATNKEISGLKEELGKLDSTIGGLDNTLKTHSEIIDNYKKVIADNNAVIKASSEKRNRGELDQELLTRAGNALKENERINRNLSIHEKIVQSINAGTNPNEASRLALNEAREKINKKIQELEGKKKSKGSQQTILSQMAKMIQESEGGSGAAAQPNPPPSSGGSH